MKDLYCYELNNLAVGLMNRGIPFTFTAFFNGGKIETSTWDAICHSYSYGHEKGLLEALGDDIVGENYKGDVEGYLTAREILDRIDNKEERNDSTDNINNSFND